MEYYYKLKKLVAEMNGLNDEVNFIKFNLDEGPKFSSVKEMKEFILKVENNNYDFLFDENDFKVFDFKKDFVESFDCTLNNIYFLIYTFESNGGYSTYLSVKSLDDDISISNLCGKESVDSYSAHAWFVKLKDRITNYSCDDILKNLIDDTQEIIKSLKIEKQKLTSEN